MTKDLVSTFSRDRTREILDWSFQFFSIPQSEVNLVLDFHGEICKKGRSYVRMLVNNFEMVLDLRDWINIDKSSIREFKEYSSFEKDPYIGNLYGTWDECLTALICHEIAHIIDTERVIRFLVGRDVERLYKGEFKNLRLRKNLFKNRPHHNPSWKEIYYILRRYFRHH